MTQPLSGLHHVTAIAGDPQKNVNFYAGVLGLRLIKLTVNFDDPGTYHLYFGDGDGHPGTVLTFFPWGHGSRGRLGTGQATAYTFSVPVGSIGYWTDRLRRAGVTVNGPDRRFDDEVIAFTDPDGIPLELIATSDARTGWPEGPVPIEHAVRGFHSVTLSVAAFDATRSLLTDRLDFRPGVESADRFRFEVGQGGTGAIVDVLALPKMPHGTVAVGTVHHVAFRVADDSEQISVRESLLAHGVQVTPVLDRQYFRSIYFREPSGVLFEVATDPPGFTKDEPIKSLGTRLMLPEWLEPRRSELEHILPPIRLPGR